MTANTRKRLWTQVIISEFARRPELVVDYYDAADKATSALSGLPYSGEYSSQLFPTIFSAEGEKTMGEILGWAGVAAGGLPYGGPLISGAEKLAETLKRNRHLSRSEQGAELWRQHGADIVARLQTQWDMEQGLFEGSLVKELDNVSRQRFITARATYIEMREAAGLPSQEEPLERLGAMLGKPWEDAGASKAASSPAPLPENGVSIETRDADVENRLRGLGPYNNARNELPPEVVAGLKRLAADQDFEAAANELRGTGQLVGLLVGLSDARTGRQITAVVDNAITAVTAFRAMSVAFSVATLATGVGAVVGLAIAAGLLGDSDNVSQDEALSKALQGIDEKLTFLADAVRQLSDQVRGFENRLDVRLSIDFEALRATNNLTLKKLDLLYETSLTWARQEDVFEFLGKGLGLLSIPTPEKYAEAFQEFYNVGTIKSTSDKWTLDDRKLHPSLELINRALESYSPEWSGESSRGAAMLEEAPTLILRLLETIGTISADRFPELTATKLKELEVTYALPGEFVDKLVGNLFSPRLVGAATSAFADAYRKTILAPTRRPSQHPGAELTFAEMLRNLESLSAWAPRVASILGQRAVVEILLELYLSAAADLVNDYASRISLVFDHLPNGVVAALSVGAQSCYRVTNFQQDPAGSQGYGVVRLFDFSKFANTPEDGDDGPHVGLGDLVDLIGKPFPIGYEHIDLYTLHEENPELLLGEGIEIDRYVSQFSITPLLELIRVACAIDSSSLVWTGVHERVEDPVPWQELGTGHAPADANPTMRGTGDYLAYFKVSLQIFVDDKFGFELIPLAIISVRDRRRFDYLPLDAQNEIFELAPGDRVPFLKTPRSQRLPWRPSQNPGIPGVCPGPYDGLALDRISKFFYGFGRFSNPFDRDIVAEFDRFAAETAALGIDLTVRVSLDCGHMPAIVARFMRTTWRMINSKEKNPIRIDSVKLEQLRQRWLDLFTSGSLYADQTRYGRLPMGLGATAPDLLTAVADSVDLRTESHIQMFQGAEIGQLLLGWLFSLDDQRQINVLCDASDGLQPVDLDETALTVLHSDKVGFWVEGGSPVLDEILAPPQLPASRLGLLKVSEIRALLDGLSSPISLAKPE